MAINDGRRLIEPGSCTWCGHKPHGNSHCPNTIQTGIKNQKPEMSPCPCAKRISLPA
jgi:hypothetical protein